MSKFGKSIISIVIILLPVLIYLVYSFLNSDSLFRSDDFHLLKTVVWMQDVDSPIEKFKLLIQQHNEHRIIFPRLLTWLDYTIEGAINWRTLVLIGNLLWVSVLWFFWKGFESKQIPVWMFIPIPYILLQPQYFDNVNWAISILQQSVIVFWFGFLCLLLTKEKFSWAILVAVLATFTHGNGIFSFVIGIIFMSLDRDWKWVIRWVCALVVVGAVYFWGFEKGQNADFQASLSDPLRLIMAFFAFFGALTLIKLHGTIYPVLCGGLFVLILGLHLVPKIILHFRGGAKLLFFDRLLLGNVLFLGITAALVSVSRSWSGIESITTARYQHYSPFVACWVYLVIVFTLNGKSRGLFAIVTIVVALLFNGASYFIYNEEVVFRKNWLVAEAENWINHAVFLNYAKSFNDNIREPYSEAVKRGVCKAEPNLLAFDDSKIKLDNSVRLSVATRTLNDRDAKNAIPREYLTISNKEISGTTYLYLKRGSEKGYWLPTHISRSSFWDLLAHQTLSKPGFFVELATENLRDGNYKIGVFNGGNLFWTGENIQISR